MNPTVVTGPVQEPVSLAEAKDHLRVDVTADDVLIDSLVTQSRERCERILGKALYTQTLDYQLDAFPSNGFINLPYTPPLQSVTSITYVDEDGNSDTVSSDDYIVDTANGRLVLKADTDWPVVTLQRVAGVTVRYVAGYTNRAGIPDSVKHVMLLAIGDSYENREMRELDDRRLAEMLMGLRNF
jgi:uncharacterized phiE125 gp8 family phage protein